MGTTLAHNFTLKIGPGKQREEGAAAVNGRLSKLRRHRIGGVQIRETACKVFADIGYDFIEVSSSRLGKVWPL